MCLFGNKITFLHESYNLNVDCTISANYQRTLSKVSSCEFSFAGWRWDFSVGLLKLFDPVKSSIFLLWLMGTFNNHLEFDSWDETTVYCGGLQCFRLSTTRCQCSSGAVPLSVTCWVFVSQDVVDLLLSFTQFFPFKIRVTAQCNLFFYYINSGIK